MTDTPAKPLTAGEVGDLKAKAEAAENYPLSSAWQSFSTAANPEKVSRLIATIEQQAEQIVKLRGALRNLVRRIDHNGGIGAYKGGPAFVMRNAREALAATEPVNDKR